MKSKDFSQKIIIAIACILLLIVNILLIISINSALSQTGNKSQANTFDTAVNTNITYENTFVIDLGNSNSNPAQNPSENVPENPSNLSYYIRVNYGAQVVNIYTKDEEGNYAIPVKAMICSTGTHTPKSGTYTIPQRWRWGVLQDNVYGQFVTQITGNILFHSVPYTRNYDPSSLEYWEYDKLGTPASAGCVRLCVEDAKWIFDNCKNGTKVEFYSDENPGPLGKPLSKLISSYPENLRNWDPSDVNENNPWYTQ